MNRPIGAAIFAACSLAVIAWLVSQNLSLRHRLQASEIAAATSATDSSQSSPGAQPVPVTSSEQATAFSSKRNASASFTLAKLLSDPEFRKSSIQKNVTSIEERFGRFFLNARDVSPEKLEAIKLLLAEQSFDLGQVAMPQSSPESESEAATRLQRMREMENSHAKALKEAMGDALYSQFQQNQATESFRGTVTGLANAVRARGFEVSGEDENNILAAYVSAMARATDRAVQEDASLTQLDGTQRNALRERQTHRIQIEITHALSKVLEGDRLNAFLAAKVSRDLEP